LGDKLIKDITQFSKETCCNDLLYTLCGVTKFSSRNTTDRLIKVTRATSLIVPIL